MDSFTSHGGRLEAARHAWPRATTPWVDLSTGVNPNAYPAPRASRDARSRLPFPEEIAALEAAAASAFGVADAARVVATPGAEAALRLLPYVVGSDTVMIHGPTYASHADAWACAGARLVLDLERAKAAVVVNPNNPDGRIRSQAELLDQADQLRRRGGWLVVDESFADVEQGVNIAAQNHPAIIVLRSFGKFYGLAGLRLGFVLGDPALLLKVRAAQGDWPISADALAAGLAAYRDKLWAARTQMRLARDAARLDAVLFDAGFQVIGGTSLFRLTKVGDAPRRFAALCAKGVLSRPFAAEPSLLRFGLPHPSVQRRVDAALRSSA